VIGLADRSRATRALLPWLWLLCFAPAAVAAQAQGDSGEYQPRMGQPGRDVVWIPSPSDMVEKMLDMARVTPQDFVIDLGSGDDPNVIAAAKRGAQALWVEYNPDLVALSRRLAAAAGVAERAQFVQGDMFAADISRATALVLFLIPDNLERLRPKFLGLKPGTRIVSNTYEIGGGWHPDDSEFVSGCASWCSLHLYIVPAQVAGTWRMGPGELTLVQEFQYLAGTYELNGASAPVENAYMRGDEIRFTLNTVEYTGRVSGGRMAGTRKGQAVHSWEAVRMP
jgi:hypothetical protein